ncbi:MAG: hypothetical protein IT392_09760 [Nitrospirae bacterium]|nr:hypothetical protein [Nitrospirota bacterium]
MNASHIHVALTHVPVIGIIFSGILLLIAFLTMDKKLQKISYWFIFFVAISAIPVFLSGEPTEGIIKKLAGVSKPMIEEHEGIAIFSFIAMIVLGLFSIIGLIIYRKSPMFPGYFQGGMMILTLIVMVLFAYTAYLGGHVRHSEIRPDFGISGPGHAVDVTPNTDKDDD